MRVKHDHKVAVPFSPSDFEALNLRLENVAFLFTLTSLGLRQCKPIFCATKKGITNAERREMGYKWHSNEMQLTKFEISQQLMLQFG